MYPVYGNPNQFYLQDLQNMRDKIDNQMRQLNQNAMQSNNPPAINQTFQLAPNQTNQDLEAKYATNIDEVKNILVMKTGIFTNKDFSTIWIKDITGNIRTFSTQEVIELDEKDRKILELEKQIENMKGMMLNAKSDNVNVNEPTTIKKSSRVSNGKSNDE